MLLYAARACGDGAKRENQTGVRVRLVTPEQRLRWIVMKFVKGTGEPDFFRELRVCDAGRCGDAIRGGIGRGVGLG